MLLYIITSAVQALYYNIHIVFWSGFRLFISFAIRESRSFTACGETTSVCTSQHTNTAIPTGQ